MDLPEELRFESLSSPAMATLFTNKTQPVSFTQQQVRFEVPRQGIQNSDSMITWSYNSSLFPVTPGPGLLGGGGNYPLNIGCKSQIERAVLSTSSGRIIMDNRNYGEKQVIESVYRDGGYGHFVGRYLNLSNWTWSYCNADDAPGSAATIEPVLAAGKIRPSGEPKFIWGGEDPTGATWCSPKILRLGGVNAPDVPQVVSVKIQSLFPFLYDVQLPVNIMEQLYIDIYWKQDIEDGDVVAMNTGATYPQVGTAKATVNQADCFLLTDNIVYEDPEVMANILAQQEANGGLAFSYTDDATQVVSTQTSVPVALQQYERDLACMNYKLCYIKNIELDGQTGDSVALYGKYYSNGRQTRSLQFSLNDANWFPDNDRTQTQNFSLATQLYPQGLLYSPRPAYALTGRLVDSAMPPAGLGGELFNQAPILDTLAGRNNVYALNLKDDAGTPFQMGNTSARLYYKRSKTNAGQVDFDTGSLSYYFLGFMREFAVMPSGKVVVSDYS